MRSTFSQPDDILVAGSGTASAIFVSGHLKNNLKTESSFLYIERLIKDIRMDDIIKTNESHVYPRWQIILVDTDIDTRITWCRKNYLLGESTVQIQWDVSNYTIPGVYRIRHSGYYKVNPMSYFGPDHLYLITKNIFTPLMIQPFIFL